MDNQRYSAKEGETSSMTLQTSLHSKSSRFAQQVRESPQVLYALSTAIVICDDNLNIVLINPSAQSLLDSSENYALGDSILSYFEQPSTIEVLKKCLHTSQPTTLRQTELVDAKHQLKLVDCILTPASIEGSICLILEFNEVHAVVKQLLGNAMKIGQNANTAVIRAIAHEIKNPLGGLRGAAQLLDRELNDNSEMRDYTQIIVKETDRLCGLVDDMSGPQIPLLLSKINIYEVLEHVRRLALAEGANGLQIVRDYDPSLPTVLGDQKQLIQVFINIARNAMEAIGNSGTITFRTRVQRQVTLGKVRYQNAARIDIEDNGPGIPEDMLDQVFYPMISGKPHSEGLGLSIVHQIILRHDGIVTCESTPGRTCFTVLLKFSDQQELAERTTVESGAVAA